MKVLITDMYHESDENEKRILTSFGIDVDHAMLKTEEELIEKAINYDALLVSYLQITERAIKKLHNLKLIVKYGIGVDNIDIEAAEKNNIAVANVPDYCTEEVATQALMLMLNAVRNSYKYISAVKVHKWIAPANDDISRLSSLKIGLYGFGRISKLFYRYVKQMVDCVMIYDPYTQKLDGLNFAESDTELFMNCNIILLFLPLNKDTQRIINKRLLSQGKNIILINTSRGGLINYFDLREALTKRNIKMLYTDVWDTEPPSTEEPITEELLTDSRVIVTPHMGWYSIQSEKELREKAATIAGRFLTEGYSENFIVKPS